jgi:hypothetical protein
LAVASTGDDATEIITVGDGEHPGGMQAAGKVVAVPIYGGSLSGSQVIFVDARKKKAPTVLSHLKVTIDSGHLNAAGIVFDAFHRFHYLLVTFIVDYGKRSTTRLYKSNGYSLFDPRASFGNPKSISNLYASQGGTQLLLDSTGKLHVAALYRTEPDGERDEKTDRKQGEEHIALSRIDGLDSASPSATLLVDRRLYDTGAWTDYDPRFRWGGTILTGPIGVTPRLQAVAVSRTLTYGPAQNYAKLRTWSQ